MDFMFYKKPEALNQEVHKGLTMGQLKSWSFAKSNAVPLLAAEVGQAAKEYPIIFNKTADSYIPMALLGLENDENLFVDKDGVWHANYVPAIVRRYPFVSAAAGDNKEIVCIDVEADVFKDPEGKPLFDEAGKPTELLNNALAFLGDFRAQTTLTVSAMKTLAEQNILKEVVLNATCPDGAQHAVGGVYIIDLPGFNALSAEALHKLFNTGALGLCYAHLQSLTNLDALAVRKTRARG